MTRYRTCHLCEAMCGLQIEVEGNSITKIRGDAGDPLSKGHICPKAAALKDIHEDPNRLRRPVKRVGDQWHEISWDEALGTVVAKVSEIRAQHGPDAFGVYLGNPNVHNYGMMTHGPQLLRLLRSKNRFSATSVDQLPHHMASFWMYGHMFLLPIPDIDHTDHLLMLGANPLVSNGSIMTAPGMKKRLAAIRARGGKVVVIDPRRTETALVADEHHFIRPGTDAALLGAILNVLFTENLASPGRLADHLDGFDALPLEFEAFTPQRAAAVCGIPAETIAQLARDFAAAKTAVCYGRMGVSTQAHGTLCQWMIQLINIATGRLDERGGAMLPLPAFDTIDPRSAGRFDRWRSRVANLPEFAGELPCAAMVDEMTTPGEGQIKAFMTAAGNPVLSTPNGSRLEEALANLDFMFSIDIYINETTRFADIILPPASSLEHDHYDLIFNLFAVRNTTRYSPPLFEKDEDALYDWQIYQQLVDRFTLAAGGETKPAMSPSQMLNYALSNGAYGKETPYNLNLKKLLENPSGIDLGPLQSQMPQRLATEDKRIHCAPVRLMTALGELENELLNKPAPELVLIGRRRLRSNNSWMNNSPRLVKGKPACVLMMHPFDLEQRGLEDGKEVTISSRTGSLRVEVQATDEVMPGVVSLPHGWGHNRKGVQLDVAKAKGGVSANDLTDHQSLDPVSGNAALNGVPVTVTA